MFLNFAKILFFIPKLLKKVIFSSLFLSLNYLKKKNSLQSLGKKKLKFRHKEQNFTKI